MRKGYQSKRGVIQTQFFQVCLLLGEKGSEALAKELAGAELLSSVVLVLKARRNLVRLARDGTLSAGAMHCLF